MNADLTLHRDGAVMTVTFNRPSRRNAMTYEMYEGLYAACETADGDDGVKALVLRGAGGQAFVSGTDIASLPADMLMDVDEMVDAALAGLELGETVTIPSLPDPREWDAFTALRLSLAPRLSLAHAAPRYASPDAASQAALARGAES